VGDFLPALSLLIDAGLDPARIVNLKSV
jgi:hypothetical protein